MNAGELLIAFQEWFFKRFYSQHEGWSHKVSREAYWGAFDTVITIINEHGEVTALHPIEVKADTDKLDERLARQLATALVNFREANLILGPSIAKTENKMMEILPANIFVYSGEGYIHKYSGYSVKLDPQFEIVKWRPWQYLTSISKRATEDFQEEFRVVKQIFLKSLSNQFSFKNEERFTLEERVALAAIRASLGKVRREIPAEVGDYVQTTLSSIVAKEKKELRKK